MRDDYYFGQLRRLYGDGRICEVNRRVLLRFDGELEAEGVKLATRHSYAFVLNRLGVWLGDRRFEDVDKEVLLEFFRFVRGGVKKSTFSLRVLV